TRFSRDWSSDVCSSDLPGELAVAIEADFVAYNDHAPSVPFERWLLQFRHGGAAVHLAAEEAPFAPFGQVDLIRAHLAAAANVEEIGRASCRKECRAVGA